MQHCGRLGDSCNLSKAVNETAARMDYSGQTITLSYDFWYPANFELDDVSFDGVMPRYAKECAHILNLTINFVKVRDPDGGKLDNGTWMGDLGDVNRSVIDGSAWGWTPLIERFEVVDFSHPVFSLPVGVVIARPQSGGFTHKTYFGEYRPYSWLAAGIACLVVWMPLYVFIVLSDIKKGLGRSFALSLSTLLRYIINKVRTENHMTRFTVTIPSF